MHNLFQIPCSPGYQPFLESIDVHINTLKSLQRSGTTAAEVTNHDAINLEHTTPVASTTITFATSTVTTSTTSSITTGHPNTALHEETDSRVETIPEEDTGSGCSVS